MNHSYQPIESKSDKVSYLPQKLVEKVIKSLTCSECGGIYRDPFTIPECMHNFCQACIIKSINAQNKKSTIRCPKCSTEIGTLANVHDRIIENRQLNDIIHKLFPDLKELNNVNRCIFYSQFKLHNLIFPDEEMYLGGDDSYEKVHVTFIPLSNPEYREDILPSFERNSVLLKDNAKISSLKKFIYFHLEKKVQLENGPEDIAIYRQGIPVPEQKSIQEIMKRDNLKGSIDFHYQKKHKN